MQRQWAAVEGLDQKYVVEMNWQRQSLVSIIVAPQIYDGCSIIQSPCFKESTSILLNTVHAHERMHKAKNTMCTGRGEI